MCDRPAKLHLCSECGTFLFAEESPDDGYEFVGVQRPGCEDYTPFKLLGLAEQDEGWRLFDEFFGKRRRWS